MSEGLRKVPEQAMAARVIFLRDESDVVDQAGNPSEDGRCLVDPAHQP